MSESVNDQYAPAAPASISVIVNEQRALRLSARRNAVEKLLAAGSARGFADLLSSHHAGADAGCGVRWIELRHAEFGRAAARLREATERYERHVLAWYALGRVADARSAHEAIVHYRRASAAETSHNPTLELLGQISRLGERSSRDEACSVPATTSPGVGGRAVTDFKGVQSECAETAGDRAPDHLDSQPASRVDV